MKVNKMFNIDVELLDTLKAINASQLVNRLLLEWKDKETLDGMTKEQLQAELEVNKLKKATEKQIKEIRTNAR